MQAVSVGRIYAEAIQAIARNFVWLLFAALPLLLLHAYVVLLSKPLIRVAFVNSFLKPADALARGGYEIRMLPGFQIAPGPGYSFPFALTVVVIIAEVLVFALFALAAHRRFLKNSSPQRQAAALVFSCAIFALLALNFLLGKLQQPMSHLVPAVWALPFQLTWTLFAVWLLLLLGTICPALANDDWRFVERTLPATLMAEWLRTLALAGLATLTIAIVHFAPQLLERALFEPGMIPLGFGGLHVYALTTIVLREWLQVVLLIALVCTQYLHFRRADCAR